MGPLLSLPVLKLNVMGVAGVTASGLVMAQGIEAQATEYALNSFAQFGAYGLSLFILVVGLVATNWFWYTWTNKQEEKHEKQIKEITDAFQEIIKEQKEEIADLNKYSREQSEDLRKSMANQDSSSSSMLELVKILQQGEPRVVSGGK